MDDWDKKVDLYIDKQNMIRDELIAKKIIKFGYTLCEEYMQRKPEERNDESIASVAIAKVMMSSTRDISNIFYASLNELNQIRPNNEFNEQSNNYFNPELRASLANVWESYCNACQNSK